MDTTVTSFSIPEVPGWVIGVESDPCTKVDIVLLLSLDILSAQIWLRTSFVPFWQNQWQTWLSW